ncbi:MAG TPA: PAS domain S-box protein [Alphaproteobacteria bacterium]|nr:PAS domain S-box protein [Alphaproteobacteria bacterium]
MIPRRVESVAERRLLILAGTPEDAKLVEGALRKTGLGFHSRQVDSESAFARALTGFAPTIVLAGSKVPGYSARAALDHVRRTHPEIPVIVLADSPGEVAAVELVKAGAKDVVFKRDIPKDGADRLAHAIVQALAWEEGRRQRKEAEEALRESEQRFRDIAEVGGDWIWETDSQHRFKQFLGESLRPTGYASQELEGKTRWELMGVDLSQDDHWRRHRADLDAHRPFRAFRYSMVDKSGQPLHLSISGKPIFDASGGFQGYRGTATNITPIIEALRRAEEAEALLRDAVESISEGFVIFDRDDRLVTCNETYRKIYEDSPHFTHTGARFEDVIRDGLQRGVHMDAVGREEEWLEERLRYHRDPKGAIEQQLVSGRSFLVTERRMQSGGTAGLRIDITALRQAETALKEEEAKFRALVEQQIAGIFIARDDGTYAYANPHFAELIGYTPAEVIGRPLLDFVVDADKAAVAASLRALTTGEVKSNQMALTVKRKNGGTADILTHRALATYEGRPAIVGVALDITERKRMEEDLRVSEERFRLLTEEAPDAILVYDADQGRFIDANRAADRLFGCGRDELLRVGPKHFYAPEQPDARPVEENFAEHIERALAGAETFFERWIHNAKGKDVLCEVRLVRLPSLEGRLIRGSFVDITERKHAEQALRRSMEGTIQAIASIVEARDPYTAGHQHRVAALAVAMAREMGLSEAQIEGIRVAGVIHDLGKINVPAEILSKPGRLSEVEFDLLKGHPRAGYDILKDIDFPWPIAQIVLQHHERIDGSGYPDGLIGEEMLIEAKILAVADVVEAMISHRPYRPALGVALALAEIERGAGRLYDNADVQACLRLFRERGFTFA